MDAMVNWWYNTHYYFTNEVYEEWHAKRVIGTPKSKKYRQCNGQKKKDKGANSDVQNMTHKTKDQVTWTH